MALMAKYFKIAPWCAAVFVMMIIQANESEAICCHRCFSHPFKWFAKHWLKKICTLDTCSNHDPDDGSMNPCAPTQVNYAFN